MLIWVTSWSLGMFGSNPIDSAGREALMLCDDILERAKNWNSLFWYRSSGLMAKYLSDSPETKSYCFSSIETAW